jgi:hypothetical protein
MTPLRRHSAARTATIAESVIDVGEASVVDVLDHVLTKGVMATGDITLGVAGIDLIYLRLSTLLCAADRVLPGGRRLPRARARRPGARRNRT